MKQDVYQMEPPGRKTEEMIIEHIDEMHDRPVVVGGAFSIKLPDVGQKEFGEKTDVPDPEIFYDLGVIVIYETVREGGEIDRKTN